MSPLGFTSTSHCANFLETKASIVSPTPLCLQHSVLTTTCVHPRTNPAFRAIQNADNADSSHTGESCSFDATT